MSINQKMYGDVALRSCPNLTYLFSTRRLLCAAIRVPNLCDGPPLLVTEDEPMETNIIRMSPAGFKAFMEALSAPARPVPEMVKLFQLAAPWESKDISDGK